MEADKIKKYREAFRKGTKKKESKHYDWRSTLDEKCWAGYEKERNENNVW